MSKRRCESLPARPGAWAWRPIYEPAREALPQRAGGDRPRAALLAGRGDPDAEGIPRAEVRRVGRGALQSRPERPSRRAAAPGTLMLPHGTGRESRVAVFAEGDKAREAQEAGADVVGTADLAKQIEEGF